MGTTKKREDRQASPSSDTHAALRERARANFSATVRQMADENHLLRHLGDLPDVEMMEAATALTL